MNKIEYDEYLASDIWSNKKKEFLSTFEVKICKACSKTFGGNKGFEIHHRTYDRVKNEELSDLVLLCKRCHSQLHYMFDKDVKTNRHNELPVYTDYYIHLRRTNDACLKLEENNRTKKVEKKSAKVSIKKSETRVCEKCKSTQSKAYKRVSLKSAKPRTPENMKVFLCKSCITIMRNDRKLKDKYKPEIEHECVVDKDMSWSLKKSSKLIWPDYPADINVYKGKRVLETISS